MALIASIPIAEVAAVTARARTEAELERQWYDQEWEWSENHVFLFTTYHFRGEPEGPAKAHRVVWYPKSSKHGGYLYYFDHYTGLMWCRAAARVRETPLSWQVLSEEERRDRIGDIADVVWDKHETTQPTIPGSSDGTLMEPPPVPADTSAGLALEC